MILRRALPVLLILGAVGVYAAWSILRPFQGYATEAFVDIPRGASSFRIAASLQTAGVIRSEWPFLLLRLTRPRATLQAGEYRFDRPLSPLDAYRKITAGDVFYFSLTIPEGFNVFDIADAVARTGVLSRQEFLRAAGEGARVSDLAPGVQSLEGFLFPDTYRLTRHTTADELIGQMLQRFRQVWTELGSPPNVLEVVKLASLVEEETSVPPERAVVASVFQNRLRRGMALQCDPTVIYALLLAGRYRGEIFKDDLSFPSPYNTYTRPGPPPGPITNPGRASLEAALHPAESDYLYFVADREGGHTFSASMERHEKAVASYRRKQNARRR